MPTTTNAIINQAPNKDQTNTNTYAKVSVPEAQASSSSASSVTNGVAQDNNNRRVPKQKWVQFPIDLSKSRSKRDRDRAPRIRRNDAAPVQNGGADVEDDDHSSDTTNKNTTTTAASRVRRFRPTTSSARGRSPNVGGGGSAPRGGRRTIGSSRPSNGPRPPRNNALNYADYPTEFRLANKLGSEGPPYLMPYMGTFYYDGVPSYKTDSLSISDAIKKQM